MKRMRWSLILVLLIVSLGACGKESEIQGKQEKQELTQVDGKETETQIPKDTQSLEGTQSHEEMQSLEEKGSESVVEETQDVSSEKEYPGADVVEVVNLRGDVTTIYKLTDGTYMDRIDRRFTYNGTDTWTDEGGAEWNETVK